MNNDFETSLDTALESVKKGDIQNARIQLGIGNRFTDSEIVEALISLSKGIECLSSQQHMAALEPLRRALPIVDASHDETTKFIIHTLMSFVEGLDCLFHGDAHRATELLNVSTEAAERIAFFIPGFEIMALGSKATAFIALAKANMNAANMAKAEEAVAMAKQVHDMLLTKLNPDDAGHALSFLEVYAMRFELALSFIMMKDLVSMDLSMFKERIDACRTNVNKLQKILEKVPEGPIKSIATAYPVIFAALEDLYNSLEIVTVKRRPFSKKEVQSLVRVSGKLFHARELADLAGDRSRAIIYQLDLLAKLQMNLLLIGKAITKDFGRFNGVVSLGSLIILIIVLHLTIKPTGYEAILYFLGGLILSLIAGFGFGALRFQLMLKLLSDAMRQKTTDKE